MLPTLLARGMLFRCSEWMDLRMPGRHKTSCRGSALLTGLGFQQQDFPNLVKSWFKFHPSLEQQLYWECGKKYDISDWILKRSFRFLERRTRYLWFFFWNSSPLNHFASIIQKWWMHMRQLCKHGQFKRFQSFCRLKIGHYLLNCIFLSQLVWQLQIFHGSAWSGNLPQLRQEAHPLKNHPLYWHNLNNKHFYSKHPPKVPLVKMHTQTTNNVDKTNGSFC